ncbi:MAG: NADH-quinone oxidoreductase subunit M [Microthrixaceae bacterium]|nr:NADH-quinone oxidoreductase subunit M [Microthrixaceae bacterium]
MIATVASSLLASSDGALPALLPALVLVPLATALLVMILPSRGEDTPRQVALMGAMVTAALAVYLLTQFQRGDAGYQFEVQATWVADWGLSWHLGVDGISLFMVVLTAVLFPLSILGARAGKAPKAYYAWMSLLIASSIGAFVALDLLLFFLCFEMVLVPMYFLIGRWGHGNATYSANKFFLYTMFGSAFMLVGLLSLVFLNSQATGRMTFDLVELTATQSISTNAARWIFASFAIAFAVKVPMFPVHTWLPDAHTDAPTAGSVILAGVLLKLGAYGLIRFGLELFPEAAHWATPVIMTLAVIGIIYGAIVASMQTDLKRLVAYSSVAHMGFIALGIFSLTIIGVNGGVLQMLNHGISTPALFLLVGWIYERRHTRDMNELGGLQVKAPVLAGFFMIVMLSSVGLPGLNGFVGEYLSMLGAWQTHRWWTVVAVFGVILAALYLLWGYQRVFHGEPTGDNATMTDLKTGQRWIMAAFVALIVVLGVYPQPVLERIGPSVERVVAQVERHSDYVAPAAPEAPQVADATHGDDHGGEGEG